MIGASSLAGAVHVNPAGLGQALIYPYYTVRAGATGSYNTYLSIVNTTSNTKAVKVRFLEGKNGKPALDFNLYLSPFDVWAAAVVPVNGLDATQGAKLITVDNSCTTPSFKANGYQLAFSNAAYAGIDAESPSLDRTNEGHFEIIEMGNITGTITTGILHTAAGVPANCAVLNDAAFSGAIAKGSGGLMGSASLINVNSGTDYSYNPVALADFNTVSPLWSAPGSAVPNLGSVFPKISKIIDDDGNIVVSDWTATAANPADPVSAVLMFSSTINEFILDTGTQSGTDWILTFPTKSSYVDNDPLQNGLRLNTAATRPFESNFGVGGSCDHAEMNGSQYDREEARATEISTLGQPIASPPILCWSANVLTFQNTLGKASNLLNSTNVNIRRGFYTNGWATLNFPLVTKTPSSAHMLPNANTTINNSTPRNAVYYGLPVVGFMAHDFINGNVGSPPVMSAYGGNFDHKGRRQIVTSIMP